MSFTETVNKMEENNPNNDLPKNENHDQNTESDSSPQVSSSEAVNHENPSEENKGANTGADLIQGLENSLDREYSYRRVDVTPVQAVTSKITREIKKVVIGQESMVELLITALLTGGHCLLEGLPGIAKTLAAKSLASSVNSPFSRIQFTPDLMPTDVSGTTVFNLKDSNFNFKKGPIFSSIVLIDEINRAPAKTQAALMEVMEEKQLTYDGETYEMPFPFFVLATQNPIEQEGTYALPEAQLDRFVFRIKMSYPSLEEEEQILRLFESDFDMKKQSEIVGVVSSDDLKNCQQLIQQVYIKPQLLSYIAGIINNTRNNGDLHLGASPRASLAIMKCSKAVAAMRGRDFVTPDDIQHVCYPILNHRVILSHEREMEGVTIEEVIKAILSSVEVPR
ncbi:MAG: AAA family ATPase [Flavobacteriales bacterium]